MPYTKKKNDKGQWCVYKKDTDGNPMGDTLGCHDSEKGADDQIAAIGANTHRADDGELSSEDIKLIEALGLVIEKGILSIDDLEEPPAENAAHKYHTAKMERCLQHLKDQGADAGKAHRICYAALKGETNKDERKSLVDKIKDAFGRFVNRVAPLMQDREVERALSSQRLFSQISLALEQFQPQPDEQGNLNSAEYITPLDLYVDQGAMYLIVTKGGKLLRSDVTVANDTVALGAFQEVTEAFPVKQEAHLKVIRASDGTRRWIAIAASSVINRIGAIDSKALFDSFVAHVEQTHKYPQVDFWHLQDAIVVGRADYVGRDDNLYIAMGSFDKTDDGDKMADALERDGSYWGTSISFLPTKPPEMAEIAQDVRVPVYTEGINTYISILPESRAASLFTSVAAQEVNRMRKEIKDALVKAFGQERADEIEKEADGTNRSITEQGLITRQADSTTATTETPAPGTTAPDQSQDEIELSPDEMRTIAEQARALSADDIKSVKDAVDAMKKVLDEIGGKLSEQEKKDEAQFKTLGERLVVLEQTDDEKRQQWQADLPKPKPVTIVRPSVQRAESAVPDLSETAKATVANMKTSVAVR